MKHSVLRLDFLIPCSFATSYCAHTNCAFQVLAIGPECDIALLSVEDEDFWKGVEPLRFGSLPRLQVGALPGDVSLIELLWLCANFSRAGVTRGNQLLLLVLVLLLGVSLLVLNFNAGCCHCCWLPNWRRIHICNKWCCLSY